MRLSSLSGTETESQPVDQPAEENHPAEDAPSPALREPVLATLPAKEKRQRFVDLAKQDLLKTGRELAEDQAPLELCFPPTKKAAKRRTKP